MPRLDPRQRLIREALLTACAGILVLACAGWWVVHQPTTPQALAGQSATPPVALPSAPPPSASLWQPLSDAPEAVVTAAPPSPPAMHLISLSQRDGRWTALIDPGDATGSQRVTGGEEVAGWRVESVTQDHVELSQGPRRHRLKFGP